MPTLTILRRAALAGLFLVAALGAGETPPPPSPAIVPPAPLRYTWSQAPGTLAYAVEIEVDHGDEIETQKGTVLLSIAPGDEGQALVSMPPLHLTSQRALKPGRSPFVPGFGPPVPRVPVVGPPRPGEFTGHEVRMDPRGRIVSERGDVQLPFALGAFIPMVFQRLPEAAEAHWQRTEDTAIRITAEWPFRSPFRGETETGRHRAEETTTLDVRAVTAARVELAWTYALKTIQTIQGQPAMELTGSGTIALDCQRGLPAEVKHTLCFHEREENREQRYPIRFSCTLMDEAALKQQQEQAQAAQAAARAAAEARRAPPTAEERGTLLADLKSGEKDRARRAMSMLQQKRGAEPDDDLAEAIAAWLGDGDGFLRQQAAEALTNWATPKAIPALLKCAEGSGFDARAAVRALGSLKEKRAVPILAAKMGDMSWRFEAAVALKAIGPTAEGPVARLLKDKDWGVRLEACRILQQVGTKDSLKALEPVAASDENPLVKQTAAAAMETIRGR